MRPEDYEIALESATTVARVGVVLEQHREALFVEEAHLQQLAEHAPKHPGYVDSSRDQGQLMKPWSLIVPERIIRKASVLLVAPP
jgi:hypothetical protein